MSLRGSSLWHRLMTKKTISPGVKDFRPPSLLMIRHLGGKMLDTRTRLYFSIPASRRASSNNGSCSLCRPTPLVKNTFDGTNMGDVSLDGGFPPLLLFPLGENPPHHPVAQPRREEIGRDDSGERGKLHDVESHDVAAGTHHVPQDVDHLEPVQPAGFRRAHGGGGAPIGPRAG